MFTLDSRGFGPFLAITTLALSIVIPGSARSAHGQNIVGEVLGRIIAPAVGPVLERAGGELLEGALNRGGDRRILPRPRPRPYPQPVPGPTYPQPVPGPTYPQPGGGRIIIEERPRPTYPAPTPQPTVAPPGNRVEMTIRPEPNASPLDIALTRVIADGPSLTVDILRAEAGDMLRWLDEAVERELQRAASAANEDAKAIAVSYRQATRTGSPSGGREDWLTSHRTELEDFDPSGSLIRGIETAIAMSELANLSTGTPFNGRQSAIDHVRDRLSDASAGSFIDGSDLAVTAERLRILKNMNVVSEIARVMGVERRSDLFARLEEGSAKSNAPSELMALLTGFTTGDSSISVPDLSLPPGLPPLALYNPLETGAAVRFVIDDEQELALEPGDIVTAVRKFILSFDNGQGMIKRYTLSEGAFQWVRNDSGWDVQHKQKVVFQLDASQSAVPFRYHLDGEARFLGPGEFVEHTSNRPPRIDFDRGLGDGSVSTKVMIPGHFVLGVDPQTSAWELYPVANADRESATPTTRKLALQKWGASVAQVLDPNVSVDPIDDVLGALLDAIE